MADQSRWSSICSTLISKIRTGFKRLVYFGNKPFRKGLIHFDKRRFNLLTLMGNPIVFDEAILEVQTDEKVTLPRSEPPGFSEKVFDILGDYLQSDTTLTIESAAGCIVDLLPDNDPRHIDIYSLAGLFFDFAEQIPYHHPSMHKLVMLVLAVGRSVKVNQRYSDKWDREWYNRYQLFGQEMRDQLNSLDEENPLEYVSYHAFVGNLLAHHAFRSSSVYAVWQMRCAFDSDCQGKFRDTHVIAAAQYIPWHGQGLFRNVRFADDLDDDSKPLITLRDWRLWSARFREFAEKV
ncbi:hypothetical protein AJ79_02906 [Helicocarpus griseus UAMH5409]|uniref:Uncharacterized protein n=1 Tax=Helicocarpus griseus UAMH5409 TaxID=1447875 RepID=A0A2B7Y0D0_9EURO|nr:hypothetical protein AJ79_02906 [Helicocarpus griseus UAMH5409]